MDSSQKVRAALKGGGPEVPAGTATRGPVKAFIRDRVDSPVLVRGADDPADGPVTLVLGWSGSKAAVQLSNAVLFLEPCCSSHLRWSCSGSAYVVSSPAASPTSPTKGTTYYALIRAMQMQLHAPSEVAREDRAEAARHLPLISGLTWSSASSRVSWRRCCSAAARSPRPTRLRRHDGVRGPPAVGSWPPAVRDPLTMLGVIATYLVRLRPARGGDLADSRSTSPRPRSPCRCRSPR